MAVKKTVAVSNMEAIPMTASAAGELETSQQVTAHTEAVSTTASDTAAATKRIDSLAKARAAKAAKKASELQVQKAATINEVANIQTALAAEARQDRHSFGEIREVGRVQPTAEEYVRVEIPLTDLFDHGHPGVQLNRHKFEPGKTYLLRGDVALEVKRRLAMFHDEQIRLLRPNADRKALNDVNRGSQWTSRGGNAIVPLGNLQDIQVASDEKIFTIDF
jgi:hypothetical protein